MKKGWYSKKLGDVCDVLKRGISPKYLEDGGICVLNQKCIRNHAVSLEPSRRHNVSIKNVPEERFVQLGDVLVNSTGTGTLGRVAQIRDLLPEQTTVDSHVTIVRPNKALFHLDFFGYAMIMIEEEIKNAGEGCGGQTELARSTLAEKFFVRFPEDANEQKRIVSILDESFEAIDIAKANTEKNLQNARALFEDYLDEVFTQSGKEWEEKVFKELIENNVIGLTKSNREQGEDKAYPYVKMNNISRDNQFDFSNLTSVDATDEEILKFGLKNGDFLFNTRNSFELVGKSCIYESDTNDIVLFNNNIMRVRFTTSIDAKFVLLAFSSKSVANKLNALKSGTTNVSAIYFKDLKSLTIPIPPITMQKKIVTELGTLRKETHRLEAIYKKKLAALEELKKSLLHQAFSGGL